MAADFILWARQRPQGQTTRAPSFSAGSKVQGRHLCLEVDGVNPGGGHTQRPGAPQPATSSRTPGMAAHAAI